MNISINQFDQLVRKAEVAVIDDQFYDLILFSDNAEELIELYCDDEEGYVYRFIKDNNKEINVDGNLILLTDPSGDEVSIKLLFAMNIKLLFAMNI